MMCPRLLTSLLLPALLLGGGSAAWESNSYADFVKGRFEGVSLTRDGRLTLAPQLDELFTSGEAGIFSAAVAADGTAYLGTGHRGRVYRVRPGQPAEVYWTAPHPGVFALALDAQGALYAAASPNGKIWKIESGQAREFFDPQAAYVWALAVAADGYLYAGTGDNGRIYRVAPGGQGELWYETGQSHVTSLAFDAQGRLLAGSEPNGILYRIEAKDRAFVLYDSPLPEIRAILPAPDGSIYVAALGGSLTRKQAENAPAAPAAAAPAGVVTTSITVTSDAARTQGGVEVKPSPETPKPPPAPEVAIPPSVYEMPGVERTAIYRIHADHTVETLWASKEENVFDLALREGELVFATDQRGRLYSLGADLKATLLAETQEGETTRLAAHGSAIYAATANLGKLFRLNGGQVPAGSYESPVHDARNVARWGRLDWSGSPANGAFAFRTRSGNSARPDRTWSEWSAPITDAAGAAIGSPNARYIQWKAELKPGAAPPALDAVTLTYQPQNTRPLLRGISVLPQWTAKPGAAGSTAAGAAAAYSITVTDTGETGPATSSGTPTQRVERSGQPQLYVSWTAEDPDNDQLEYALYYRGEDEREWKLLKDHLKENTYAQEADIFADGRYFFRVVASDRWSNTPSDAREAELVSPPVVIDQTPPVVSIAAPAREGVATVVRITATDGASPIRRVEFSLDAAPWRLLEADDGITDSPRETFTLRLPDLAAGEHTLVIRALDAAGNPGLAKIVLR